MFKMLFFFYTKARLPQEEWLPSFFFTSYETLTSLMVCFMLHIRGLRVLQCKGNTLYLTSIIPPPVFNIRLALFTLCWQPQVSLRTSLPLFHFTLRHDGREHHDLTRKDMRQCIGIQKKSPHRTGVRTLYKQRDYDYSALVASSAGVSATGAVSSTGAASAAAFLERRVRVAFFLVLAMFSL